MKPDHKVQVESSPKESFVAGQTKQTPSEDGAAKNGAAIQEALADQKLEAKQKTRIAGQTQPDEKGETEETQKLNLLTVKELLALDIPVREMLLSPWLPMQGLTMVYAPRGLGKTWFALCVAYAVACGGKFLKWCAEKASGVLYVDGEMPVVVMKQRMAQIVASNEKEPEAPLLFLTPDQQELGIPDLSKPEGQKAIDSILEAHPEIKLIVLDNLSTLCRSGKESDGESWVSIQEWVLRLRSKKKSVLFVHHTGKSGDQRGTSKREDVLDTVIALKRSIDYTPDKGAQFEVHFGKARGLYGEEVQPFEAHLIQHSNNQGVSLLEWECKSLEDSTYEKVVRLSKNGYSQPEIAKDLDLHKSSVSRHLKRAKKDDLLSS